MSQVPEKANRRAPIPRRGAIAVVRHGARFLVIRRSQHVVAPGKFCFPGGGIEPGESEQDALVRELAEELAVQQPRVVRRLWRSVTPWNVALAWWLVEWDHGTILAPDPREVESCHWWTAEEMRQEPDVLVSNLEFLAAWQAGHFDFS